MATVFGVVFRMNPAWVLMPHLPSSISRLESAPDFSSILEGAGRAYREGEEKGTVQTFVRVDSGFSRMLEITVPF